VTSEFFFVESGEKSSAIEKTTLMSKLVHAFKQESACCYALSL